MIEFEQSCACGVCQSESKDVFQPDWSALAQIGGLDMFDSGVVFAGGVDVPGDITTTATITIGGSVTDELETVGDTDWYAITLTAGQAVNISLFGSGATPVGDTFLRIYDASGNELSTNDDGGEGLNSLLRFTAETSGTYYIAADSYQSRSTGQYTLTVEEAQPLQVYSVDQIVDQLTAGYWGGTQRSYNIGADRTITVNLTALPANEQFLARSALDMWSDVTGITFSEVSGGAQITFINTEEGAYASSSRSGGTITSSTVNIAADWVDRYGDTLTSYSYQTYIHEIGHALGLGHGGNYNGGANYATDALYLNDSWATTVMSYFDQTENGYFAQLGFTRARVVTPMMADVAAAIELYGASTTTRTGDTIYGFNSTSDRAIHDATSFVTQAYTIVDSGGFDTLDYSGFSNNQLIDLNVESFMNIGGVIGNVSIGRGTVIEAAKGGSGNDTILGNTAVNYLYGNNGDDTIAGNGGSDVLYGGMGNDTVSGDAGFDLIYGGAGADTMTGDNGDDTLFGGDGDDVLYGNNGWDLLRGDGGADTIYGGNGNDKIRGDDGNDVLNGELGNDLIRGGFGEDLMRGGDGNDWMEGDGGSDTLLGEAGDDILLGASGWDRLIGGDGNDQLDGGNGNDFLRGGFGVDTLTGGLGADDFSMEMYGQANLTIITDFDVARDEILLQREVGFGSLDLGDLAASAFVLGTQARDADDRILYDQATGNIYYDADGNGAGQAYLFARVTAGTALTADHFRATGDAMPPPPLSQAEEKLVGAEDFVI